MTIRVPMIFGTMTFGEEGKSGTRTSKLEDCQKILDVFVKHGGKELDTARVYSEGTTEKYLSQLNLHDCVVDSKAHPYSPGAHSPENLRKTIETSVSTLGKNIKIRTLYLHWPDRSVKFEDSLRALDALHKEGKFEQLGLSNYSAWEVAEFASLAKAHNLIQPKVYQVMYNGITRAIEEELIPCLRYWNIRLVVFNPLAGGFLTGKIQRDNLNSIEPGSRFDNSKGSISENVGKMYQARYFRERYFDAIDHLKPIVEKNKITLAEAALRWLQHHSMLKETDGVIIGATSTEQLEQNMTNSAKGPLPNDIVQAMDEAWLMVKGHGPLYWR